jgi:hypothetical protein
VETCQIFEIIIIIIIIITTTTTTTTTVFMQCIYNYISETNYISQVCSVAAVL